MRAHVTNPLVFEALMSSSAQSLEASTIPAEVRSFLARLRLLEGVPFSHLVPDADLLPLESIRFFYIDREWTDAMVEGALAVGTITTVDREQLQASYGVLRDEIDSEERRIRSSEYDELRTSANTITGFLLRSAAVSGWPGLHVRAYREEVPDDENIPDDDKRRIRLLRLERLAPAVLLGLFDGVPTIVHIEEPRQGIQFGVDLKDTSGGTGAVVRLRDAETADNLLDANDDQRTEEVPFRQGAPGVVHVTELATRIAAIPETHVTTVGGPEVSSSELAMQLLQFPYRQVFGPSRRLTISFDDVFKPMIEASNLRRLSGG